MKERLQKVISNRGFCSRRRAEFLIQHGRVKIGTEVVKTVGAKVEPNAEIFVDNKAIPPASEKIYLMFNKPRNVICSNYDPAKRKIILNYLTSLKERVYSIGRLDYDTSGLLILTNDGNFANKVMHPRYEIIKTYDLEIAGRISNEQKYKLESGI